MRRVAYVPPKWMLNSINPAVIPKSKLELGRFPTPFHAWNLDGVLKDNPKNLQFLIKRDDLSSFDLSGNKVRKLQFLLADAQEKQCDSVITIGGVQSNHARATAVAARQLGMDPWLILRTTKADDEEVLQTSFTGNLLFDRMVGAHVQTVTSSTYATVGSNNLVDQLHEQLKEQGRNPYPIPVGGSNTVGVFGYLDAINELLAQNIEFDHLVFACGSGGTAAGLSIGARLSGIAKHVHAIGVCDSPEYFYSHITDTATELGLDFETIGKPEDWLHIHHGAGLGYARNKPEELEFIMAVSQQSGILLDPVYSGKGFYYFVNEYLEANGHLFDENDKVMFLHTGGVYGLYDKTERGEMTDILISNDKGSFSAMNVTYPEST